MVHDDDTDLLADIREAAHEAQASPTPDVTPPLLRAMREAARDAQASPTPDGTTPLVRAIREVAQEASQDAPSDPSTDSTCAVVPLPPADFIPGYKILKELHRGGQGVVNPIVA